MRISGTLYHVFAVIYRTFLYSIDDLRTNSVVKAQRLTGVGRWLFAVATAFGSRRGGKMKILIDEEIVMNMSRSLVTKFFRQMMERCAMDD